MPEPRQMQRLRQRPEARQREPIMKPHRRARRLPVLRQEKPIQRLILREQKAGRKPLRRTAKSRRSFPKKRRKQENKVKPILTGKTISQNRFMVLADLMFARRRAFLPATGRFSAMRELLCKRTGSSENILQLYITGLFFRQEPVYFECLHAAKPVIGSHGFFGGVGGNIELSGSGVSRAPACHLKKLFTDSPLPKRLRHIEKG